MHVVADPRLSSVRLSGELSTVASERLVVVVHGLGGSAKSADVRRMARAINRAGWGCLRINLRGADLAGEDIYHAGLCSDLASVLGAAELQAFRQICLIGFSLGGHVSLKLAATELDPRVRAIASVSAPLDLAESARYFDERVSSIYRRHILTSLKRMLARVEQRRGTLFDLEATRRIERIQDWDERIVAPRFGFRSAQDYYRSVNARDTMGLISVPTLLVHSLHDPMVGMNAVSPGLGACSALVTRSILERGGHVGFPGNVDLGMSGPPGLENQLLAWLDRYLAE